MENTQSKVVLLKMNNGKMVLSAKPQSAAPNPQPKLHTNLVSQIFGESNICDDDNKENSFTDSNSQQHNRNVPLRLPANIKRLPMASTSKLHSSIGSTSHIDMDLLNQKIDAAMEKLNRIEQRQQDHENDRNKRMSAMEKNQSIIKAKLDLILDKLSPRSGLVPTSTFQWEAINTKENLDEFEQQLGMPDYKQKLHDYLECQLPTDNSEERLHAAMDLLFGRAFLTEMSWTGIGHPNNKIPMCTYVNILALYKHIGTFHGVTPTQQKIKQFFQNKLKHAGQRLHLLGKVKSTHHRHRQM
ncbi:uncharacterized protein LOC128298760 [Anopheles moucheti]|uniref:uncharacterized protein LOC128298760 n=1 Tax=Anopheles moucheti TaxID=186751 RepID=UPI0022F02CD4|nr:uncharacterized protein LOC128298760 [Anopheles moucheti]